MGWSLALEGEHALREVEGEHLKALVVVAFLLQESLAVGQEILDLDVDPHGIGPARDVDVIDALDRALESLLVHGERLEDGDRVCLGAAFEALLLLAGASGLLARWQLLGERLGLLFSWLSLLFLDDLDLPRSSALGLGGDCLLDVQLGRLDKLLDDHHGRRGVDHERLGVLRERQRIRHGRLGYER